MILYYCPIAQNTGNKTVSDFFSEVYMLVYVCAHILIFFLFTGLIPVYYKSTDNVYCSIALQMEHCFFGNNIKSKMRILTLIGNISLNQKTLINNIFLSLHAFS